jgi:hypothetical protein
MKMVMWYNSSTTPQYTLLCDYLPENLKKTSRIIHVCAEMFWMRPEIVETDEACEFNLVSFIKLHA